MTEPVVTGTDVLRQTVKARNRSPHAISLIARELDGVGAGTLEDFAAGKIDLGVEALKALTKILYPHSEYDSELNLLRSANRAPAISIGSGPPRIDPTTLPKYRAGPAPLQTGYPPSPKPKQRAGWLDSWL